MSNFTCFSLLIKSKKKDKKRGIKSSRVNEDGKDPRATIQIKLKQPVKLLEINGNVREKEEKVLKREESPERAYEGEDENERSSSSSIRRNLSDLGKAIDSDNLGDEGSTPMVDYSVNRGEGDFDDINNGHVSDPGVEKTRFLASPKLKRSCSNLETSEVLRKVGNYLPVSKSQSFEKLNNRGVRFSGGSPVRSHCSADRVMLKKHSSSQVLPSRSRRLWWKLFLWSHRNVHKPKDVKPQLPVFSSLNQQGGYSSDTVEPNQAMVLRRNMESPGSFTPESLSKSCNGNQFWGGFNKGSSSLWPQNQWVAFSADQSSSFNRVDEWVKDHIHTHDPPPANEDDDGDDDNNKESIIIFPPSPNVGRSPGRTTLAPDVNIRDEILYANTIIQTLNSSSTVAHISGIGLKAMPTVSHLSSLRSVNLSNNSIVHITSGSLPKSLHSLNLSRNKINTIEGLKELTRLRVLDLSYNRIVRIGQGLSNCTGIKELYLAGNKISEAEGLHRLLKLTVLDLSFNKVTTTKSLGQLVANYNSLLALNLLGNPIQNNISDEQLRKSVCGLLPKLVYLNKQGVKPQRAREVVADSVAKAALGNSSRSKTTARKGKQLIHTSGHKKSVGGGHKSKSKSKSGTHSHLHPKTLSSQ